MSYTLAVLYLFTSSNEVILLLVPRHQFINNHLQHFIVKSTSLQFSETSIITCPAPISESSNKICSILVVIFCMKFSISLEKRISTYLIICAVQSMQEMSALRSHHIKLQRICLTGVYLVPLFEWNYQSSVECVCVNVCMSMWVWTWVCVGGERIRVNTLYLEHMTFIFPLMTFAICQWMRLWNIDVGTPPSSHAIT